MSTPARCVRGARANPAPRVATPEHDGDRAPHASTTSLAVRKAEARPRFVALTFRDQLRIEYDSHFREFFLKVSSQFDRLPNRAWNGVRRNPLRAEHPWGRLLVLLDDAIREGASEDTLLEAPAILTAYIHTRCAMCYTTPTAGVMTIPEDARRVA